MDEPLISITSGKLQGRICNAFNEKPFYSFQGIPYAKPPVGELRFKAPVPIESWTGIYNATKEGDACLQYNPYINDIEGSENCLTLNVYSPCNYGNNEKSLPVMVWIHGGAFVSGSGSSSIYGPEFLMTENIVLVTVNYRVGILGFLRMQTPELKVPGNAGLKDMVLALKWVQQNIGFFNGNRNNVTIFGESAGGAACHYLILSPMAKNLFHKAILQSGCALNLWTRGQNFCQAANILNLAGHTEQQILEILQGLSSEELLQTFKKLPDPFNACDLRICCPVVEEESPSAFLTKEPLEIISSGKYNHVPMIFGYTTREGMLTQLFSKDKFYQLTDFEKAIPRFLNIKKGSTKSHDVAKKIKEFYYKYEEPSPVNIDQHYLLETDNLFFREIIQSIELHSATSPCPIFLYRISLESSLNFLKTLAQIKDPGVCHADELGYLFKNLFTPEISPGSVEDIAIQRFVTMWTNFAKYGNPTILNKNSLVTVNWDAVTRNSMKFLDIGEKLEMMEDPEPERMTFWKQLILENRHKL